ncbi:hypothetical protein QFZ34_000396 [Phyllobacterium ifriqiyense]|uniref:Uncharacterized protein n=1 Tax=Phyllobacterium ifriqiyense TaxID=314238 RepID=A0ABU0S3C2_9HYPH|nr:hypothetical protein [Phyllobacterium ifriqiyense]
MAGLFTRRDEHRSAVLRLGEAALNELIGDLGFGDVAIPHQGIELAVGDLRHGWVTILENDNTMHVFSFFSFHHWNSRRRAPVGLRDPAFST